MANSPAPSRRTIVSSQRPPTRGSMRTRSRGVSTCSGPYHAATSSGSVQARNTFSRGASKMRVISTSCSAAATGVGSLIWLSFSAQVRVESVHPGLPGLLARLHPVDRLVERLGLEPARPPLRLPAADDQPRALEHLQVPRDRREAHRERLRELVDGRLALGEAREDRAARRVGEGGEREAEVVGRHVTVRLINAAIKYHRRNERNSAEAGRQEPCPTCTSFATWTAGR